MADNEQGPSTDSEQGRRDLGSATPDTASPPVAAKRGPAKAILVTLVVLAVLAVIALVLVIPNGGNTP